MKLAKIIVFSILEALTIGLLWDFFFDKGQIVLASALTFLLLAVEHIFARNTANGKNLFHALGYRFGQQAILGLTEIIFWDVWRLIHERIEPEHYGPILAVVVFAVLMIAQHNVEQNVNSNSVFLKGIFRSQGIVISVIEAVTAMAWIFAENANGRVLALIPLFLGLLVEHVVREFGEPLGANV